MVVTTFVTGAGVVGVSSPGFSGFGVAGVFSTGFVTVFVVSPVTVVDVPPVVAPTFPGTCVLSLPVLVPVVLLELPSGVVVVPGV